MFVFLLTFSLLLAVARHSSISLVCIFFFTIFMAVWVEIVHSCFVQLLYLVLEVSIGRTDHGLVQSNSFWAGYGRAQLINGPTGQKTNWYMVQLDEDQMDNESPWASLKHNFMSLTKENIVLQLTQKNSFIVKIKN